MALYIAAAMYVSIVATALILNSLFALAGIVPQSRKAISDITRFNLDYTFWLNLASVIVVFVLENCKRRYREIQREKRGSQKMDQAGKLSIKRLVAYSFACVIVIGLVVFWMTQRI